MVSCDNDGWLTEVATAIVLVLIQVTIYSRRSALISVLNSKMKYHE